MPGPRVRMLEAAAREDVMAREAGQDRSRRPALGKARPGRVRACGLALSGTSAI